MLVAILEDHPLIRGALHALLKRMDPGLEVHEADRLAALDGLIHDYGEPALVLLDLTLPDARGGTTVREVQHRLPNARIVVVSAASEADYGDLVRELGAVGYIEKSSPLSAMEAALRPLLDVQGRPLDPNIRLTKRQKQILQLMSDGLSNHDISEQLGLSEHTVKVHAWRLFRKLDVSSRTQAAHVARCMGWVDPLSP